MIMLLVRVFVAGFPRGSYLADRTVVFDGPLMTRFLNEPANVRLPPPFDTCTASISNGSKCSTPISGIPLAKYGKIPWNIRRKQSSFVGCCRLHVSNQSAGFFAKRMFFCNNVHNVADTRELTFLGQLRRMVDQYFFVGSNGRTCVWQCVQDYRHR